MSEDTGKPSDRCSTLARAGRNIGILDVSLPKGGMDHRLVALQLDVPGWGRHLVASTYLVVSHGLSDLDLTILHQLPRLQEQPKSSCPGGGGFQHAN